jgi:predicted ArsR family transcriptional regulator
LPVKERILNALKQDHNLKVKDMAVLLGLTDQGVRYHLDILKAEGRVVREGATKKPVWRVVG